jgi:hypothetical protein
MPIIGSSASQSGRIPGVATITGTTAGNGQVTVAFNEPAFRGKGTVTYTVTSSPSGITATGPSSPIIVTGLSNGTSYTFTVTVNAGIGVASSASSSSSPVSPVVPTFSTSYLVIAGGGGGGGNSFNTGGGGAGGYRNSVSGEQSGAQSSAETPLTITQFHKKITGHIKKQLPVRVRKVFNSKEL